MDNHEMKIRKGQAFNLAVNDAVANNNQSDPKYIYQQFIYYYTLADVIQSSDLDMIQEVLNKPNFDKAIKELKEAVK